MHWGRPTAPDGPTCAGKRCASAAPIALWCSAAMTPYLDGYDSGIGEAGERVRSHLRGEAANSGVQIGGRYNRVADGGIPLRCAS
jgi:hypothetical protein